MFLSKDRVRFWSKTIWNIPLRHGSHKLEVMQHVQTIYETSHEIIPEWIHTSENTIQISAWKVNMLFAAKAIHHCQFMYRSCTSGHRKYHQHIVKSISSVS